jgi:hypothetical protein
MPLFALDPKHYTACTMQRLGTLSISVISSQPQVYARPRQGHASPARAHGKTPAAGNCIRSTMSNNKPTGTKPIGLTFISKGTSRTTSVVEPIGIEPTTSSLQS